jgi:hypothetical protein
MEAVKVDALVGARQPLEMLDEPCGVAMRGCGVEGERIMTLRQDEQLAATQSRPGAGPIKRPRQRPSTDEDVRMVRVAVARNLLRQFSALEGGDQVGNRP